ncbi:MAG: acyl-CoA dehydrogenase family protein [Theionarchaea archaeon]|nr:acyl-CoA dehydrogenase family protein [Theionarchaea archaeon]
MVDFKLSLGEEELFNKAKEFAHEHITPVAADLEKQDEYPMDVVQKAYEAGLMNLHVPKEVGGQGRSLLEETLVSEATGYGCAGLATSIMCNNLAFAPILIGATAEQLKKYVSPLITGKKVQFGAFCLTERESGSDAASIKTTATKEGDGWVINGAKCFITNAPVASLHSVFASTDPSKGYKGLACFMVPAGLEGVEIGYTEKKMGQKNSVQSEVIFTDVHIPGDCLIGNIGDGFKIAMMTLDKTRAGIAAIATGVAQRCVDEAAKFSNVRRQFGKPIGANQGISFMLSDMDCRTEAARWLTRYAAWLADNGIRNSKESAFAKYFASDAAMQNAVECVQIMGGYGYLEEYPAEKLMRDAKLLQIYEGTNQIQRMVASSVILKENPPDKDTGFRYQYEGRDAPQI